MTYKENGQTDSKTAWSIIQSYVFEKLENPLFMVELKHGEWALCNQFKMYQIFSNKEKAQKRYNELEESYNNI